MLFLLLAAAFLLELIALFAFVVGITSQVDGIAGILLALAVMLGMAALWGMFAAPKARYPLKQSYNLLFKTGFFALASLGLYAAYGLAPAAIFFGIAVINAGLLLIYSPFHAQPHA